MTDIKERMARNEEKSDSAHKRLTEESAKWETYRSEVHERSNKTHNIINLFKEKTGDALADLTRRADSMEHIVQNQADLMGELKTLVKEVATAVDSLQTYMTKAEAKGGVRSELFICACKLTALFTGAIGIIKYFGLDK